MRAGTLRLGKGLTRTGGIVFGTYLTGKGFVLYLQHWHAF